MAKKNFARKSAVIKAMSIGLSLMMTLSTPVTVLASDAPDPDPNGGNNNNDPDKPAPQNETEAIEEKYEEEKEKYVPSEEDKNAPGVNVNTTTSEDGATTKEVITSSEETITVETINKVDGNTRTEDITVKTETTSEITDTTIKSDYIETSNPGTPSTASSYTNGEVKNVVTTESNNSYSVSNLEEYENKINEIKAGKDFTVTSDTTLTPEDYIVDGVVVGKKSEKIETVTYRDDETGEEVVKTIKTTVITYNDAVTGNAIAADPTTPDKISLGTATDDNSASTLLPSGAILIETNEKTVSAYTSKPNETYAEQTTVSKTQTIVEAETVATKMEAVSEFDTADAANEAIASLTAEDKALLNVVLAPNGKFVLIKNTPVDVPAPADIKVIEGEGKSDFVTKLNDTYKVEDGWVVIDNNDNTWTVSKIADNVITTYTYTFKEATVKTTTTPIALTEAEKEFETDATSKEDFATKYLSGYTEADNWIITSNTDNTGKTTWVISKKEGETTTQHTYTFTPGKTTPATSETIITKATSEAEFKSELEAKYASEIKAGTAKVTNNGGGKFTVIKKGANPHETVTEVYNFTTQNVYAETITASNVKDFEIAVKTKYGDKADRNDDGSYTVTLTDTNGKKSVLTYSYSNVNVKPDTITAATQEEFDSHFDGNNDAKKNSDGSWTVTVKTGDNTKSVITYVFTSKDASSPVETVDTEGAKTYNEFEATVLSKMTNDGWTVGNPVTDSTGKTTWTVSKTEGAVTTSYVYSFSTATGASKTETSKASKASLETELKNTFGLNNVVKSYDAETKVTTYTCTKTENGTTKTYVYSVNDRAEFATNATSIEEFKAYVQSRYPGYDVSSTLMNGNDNGNINKDRKYTCIVKDGNNIIAQYTYEVSPDSSQDHEKGNGKGGNGSFKFNPNPELRDDDTIESFLAREYAGWDLEYLGNNKWRASTWQNGSEKTRRVQDITFTENASDGVVVRESGTTLEEILRQGDPFNITNVTQANITNYQKFTIITAVDAVVGNHENGGVYAGGVIGGIKWENGERVINKDLVNSIDISDYFNVGIYDSEESVSVKNKTVQKVDATSDEIQTYWNAIAEQVQTVAKNAGKAYVTEAGKKLAGVYEVGSQIVANYDEWKQTVAENVDNSISEFIKLLSNNKDGGLLGIIDTGNQGYTVPEDNKGQTGKSNVVIVTTDSSDMTIKNFMGALNFGLILAPNADIDVESSQNTGTLIGKSVMTSAQGHTNITAGDKITEGAKKLSVSIKNFKVKAEAKFENIIATLTETTASADRKATVTTGSVSATAEAGKVTGSGYTGKADVTPTSTIAAVGTHSGENITNLYDSSATSRGDAVASVSIETINKLTERFGFTSTTEKKVSNSKSLVILGKTVTENTDTRVIPPTTPPVTPPTTPPVTPPTTPPVTPPTPPVTPPTTPDTPVVPGTPVTPVEEVAEAPAADAAVLGARRTAAVPSRGVLGARRKAGVLGEKRVLGARTDDTTNTAAAYGVILGSVALCGAWLVLRRKKSVQ